MNVVPLNRYSGQRQGRSASSSKLIAALDVGSTKVCCLIGEAQTLKRPVSADRTQMVKIRGVGHQISRGVRGGVIVDLEEAERSIRLAVDAAERMAGETISEVFVNVSGGRPQCTANRASIRVGGVPVGAHHVRHAIDHAVRGVDPAGRLVLHITPMQFDLDDAKGVTEPEGMYADRLSVDVNAVTVEPAAMRNLTLAIERCHLNVAGFVIAPYAAGRSVLVDDELSLGVTMIEMGGATTSVAVFAEGHLLYADVIPVGGLHVTSDLARGLTTSIADAERIKTLYGSALPAVCDDRELVNVPLLGEHGEHDGHKVPRSMLTGIIRPRLEETFELIRDRLEQHGAAKRAGRRVVLSGGASQMTGVREVASQILDRHIRVGTPYSATSLPDAARAPSFSVAAGLLDYALKPDRCSTVLPGAASAMSADGNYFMRVGKWIKESF